MTSDSRGAATLLALDDETRALVRLSAIVASGSEPQVRNAIAEAQAEVRAEWVEELLLQTYLFAGFPRALNAEREWRRVQPVAPPMDSTGETTEDWRRRGLETCAAVYGTMYERLRHNVRDLHPLLDEWMIVEGYGKVLSRPGLDLARRELCIVAACAATKQERQLHSHLHGALNVGVDPIVIDAAIASLSDLCGQDTNRAVRLLWARVRGK